MEASLQLLGRNVIGDAESAKTTFSSWDNCMAKSYCKYPVIIAIVVGSLIVLSIVFCVARCLCCGAECCCACFSCFRHCCPSGGGRNRRSRYADPPSGFAPNPYQGYQPTPNAPPAYEPPRFAQFDVPTKNGKPNEDALPAMPSWDNAPSKRVSNPDAQGDVEMGNLNRQSGQALGIAGGPGGRGRYSQVGAISPGAHEQQQAGYGGQDPYGDIGNQQARPDYDYGRPSPPAQQSYRSPYNTPLDTGYRSPTSNPVPQGGYVSPPSADQFHPAAIAPTPNQYNTGQFPQTQSYGAPSLYTASSTRYEPSAQYDQGQATGYTSPTNGHDNRPPSLLQTGRKPIAGSWRDV